MSLSVTILRFVEEALQRRLAWLAGVAACGITFGVMVSLLNVGAPNNNNLTWAPAVAVGFAVYFVLRPGGLRGTHRRPR
jgi:flagellar biosynthesis protein FliQ